MRLSGADVYCNVLGLLACCFCLIQALYNLLVADLCGRFGGFSVEQVSPNQRGISLVGRTVAAAACCLHDYAITVPESCDTLRRDNFVPPIGAPDHRFRRSCSIASMRALRRAEMTLTA